MRIAAHIGVKDEATLIGPCIEHLRRIGVETFIVCDMASTDGTREILRCLEGPEFRVIDSSNSESPDTWNRINADAIASCGADFVLAIDADEFPLPRSGDLRADLDDADIIQLPRYNTVLGREGLLLPLPCTARDYPHTRLIAKSLPKFRDRLAEDPALAWIRFVPLPKIAVRPEFVAGIKDGMHDVVPHPGQAPRRAVSANIIIAHAALTSFDRFARKVENIRGMFAALDSQLAANFGWHWRRWVDLADRGCLREEFGNSVMSDDDILRLEQEGIIRSAADLLGER